MAKIFIMDVSPFVHQAQYSKQYKYSKKQYGYPVGGILSVLETLTLHLGDMDQVILAFDSKSFRKDLSAGYKGGRPLAPEVYSQLETLYEELSSCGIPCYKFDGIEADDIINWAVKQNRYDEDGYRNEIVVYGNDYDLAINVQNFVQFRSINPAMVNDVTSNTLTEALPYKEEMLINTVGIYKVFCGDSSDKISVFQTSLGFKGKELYRECIAYIKNEIASGRLANSWDTITNPALILKFAANYADPNGNKYLFTAPDILQNLKSQIKLVYPAENVDKHIIKPITKKDFNMNSYAMVLNRYGCEDLLRLVDFTIRFKLSDQDIQVLTNKAKQLTSGVYSVNRNMPAHKTVPSTSLNDMDFLEGDFS